MNLLRRPASAPVAICALAAAATHAAGTPKTEKDARLVTVGGGLQSKEPITW
jgi:hypothetical protein